MKYVYPLRVVEKVEHNGSMNLFFSECFSLFNFGNYSLEGKGQILTDDFTISNDEWFSVICRRQDAKR